MAWAVSVDAMAYIRGNISNTYLRLKLLFQLAVVIYLPAPFLTFREHLPSFFSLYCPVNLFTVVTETNNITKGYFAHLSKAPRLRGIV